jgi:hypothetical protein
MPGPSSSKLKKLLDQRRDAIRIIHDYYSTEKKRMSIGQSATFSFMPGATLLK